MKLPLTLALHLPPDVYRPEFLRRVFALLQFLESRMSRPERWTERSQLGEYAREVLLSPHCKVKPKPGLWQKRLAVVESGVSTLLKFTVQIRLPDDVDQRAFQRRITDLMDGLEIQLGADQPDQVATTLLARQVLDCPREFGDQVRTEVGYAAAF